MNNKQLREYINYYQPYASNNPGWAKWYVTVAPIKAERTVKLLKKYKNSGSKVLDYGCGIGLSLYYLSKFYKNITGIDVDPLNIKIAKKQFKKLNCKAKLQLYDGKKLPYPDNTFDLVVSMEVWEHVENPDIMLAEIKRVLKPDGILHITTANKLWPIEPHYHLPFLSYLPYWLSDFYVRITGRAPYYHDIHLPTYPEFKKSVGKYFKVDDVTLEMIVNYSWYGLEKERGRKIVALGKFLGIINKLKGKFPLSVIRTIILEFLSYISLGWLFIVRPKQ